MADDKKAADDKYLAESRKSVEERVAKAYEHETPTPTQEENDAAKLAAMGLTPEIDPPPADQRQRSIEGGKSGDYQTRSAKPGRE